MKAVTNYKLLILAVFTCTITILLYLRQGLFRNESYSTNFRAFGETEVETSFNQIGEFSKFIIKFISTIINELYFIKWNL